MKILLISAYPDGLIFGGVEAVANALVPALCKHKHIEELNIVSFEYCRKKPNISSRPIEKGLHYKIYSKDKFELLTKMAGDVKRLKNLCDYLKPDIVHGQGFGKEGVLAVQQNFPSVITLHGLIHIERRMKIPNPTITQKLKFWLADKMVDLVLERSDLIISTSKYDKNFLIEKNKKSFISIPNPVPLEFFDKPVINDDRRILFVGVVQPRKNIMGIIRAFAKALQKVPRAELRIVGPTPFYEYNKSLNELIEELGIKDKITWLGHISQEKLILEYASCAFVVMFSLEETSPMAIAQATAIGKPVVSSDVGGISDMIIDGENGFLIPSENDQDLANKITQLLMDEQLRNLMGKNAKEIAYERCHPNKVAERTVHAYQTICCSNKGFRK